MKFFKPILKFIGALMSSWALFSVLRKFSRNLARNFADVAIGSAGTSYINSLSVEMLVLAIGLTLLFTDFEFMYEKE